MKRTFVLCVAAIMMAVFAGCSSTTSVQSDEFIGDYDQLSAICDSFSKAANQPTKDSVICTDGTKMPVRIRMKSFVFWYDSLKFFVIHDLLNTWKRAESHYKNTGDTTYAKIFDNHVVCMYYYNEHFMNQLYDGWDGLCDIDPYGLNELVINRFYDVIDSEEKKSKSKK